MAMIRGGDGGGDLAAVSLVAGSLDFVPIAGNFWPIVALILLSYIVPTQFVKMWPLRK